MIYEGYRDQHKFNGMEVVVLPDDDERLKELKPGCIGADMNHFYVSESMWETLKEQLFALRSNAPAKRAAESGSGLGDELEGWCTHKGLKMKKIISLFQRNYDGNMLVRDEIVPGAEWVVAGEGIATRKFDGTCCMVRGGKLWKRYDAKAGKTLPAGFEAAQEADPVTGHWHGWLPVGDGPEDKWHRAADMPGENGTYELCGPKVQGNPEGFDRHVLVKHGAEVLHDCPRTFEELREYLAGRDIEGVVWWNEGGRAVKIKGNDFGIKRKPSNTQADAPPSGGRGGARS